MTFTPTNTADYNAATATVAITVLKATPAITWPTPAAITVRDGAQWDAVERDAPPVAGTFVYTPASGTLLGAGAGQTLSVTFTPTNTADYNPATATVAITVLPLSLPTVTLVNPASGSAAGGTAVTISGTGFVTGATVAIGGTAATSVNVVTAQTITAVTAAHSPGAVAVVVTNPDGQLATRTNGFTYFVPFTDGLLQRGVSLIRAPHIIELRQRINAVRARLNLSPFAWSDAALSATSGTPIRAQHIIDLRSALQGIYVALNLPLPLYTDPTLVAGTTLMKLEHITEIRAALIAVE